MTIAWFCLMVLDCTVVTLDMMAVAVISNNVV